MPNSMNGRRQELAQPDVRSAAAVAEEQVPAFRFDVRRSVRMHPLLAASVAGAVFLLLVLYALTRKPVYEAESLIYVEPLEVRVLNDGSSSGYDPSRYDSYLQQQVQTIQREDTLEAAVAKIPAGVWSLPGESTASAAKRLGLALKTPQRVLNSYQVAIDVTANNPGAAAAGANAITEAYLEKGRKDEHARADQRLQLLTEERDRITDDMTRDKAEQASLGTSLGVANPTGASGNPYDVQSEGLRSQLAAAREAHDTVAAQLASVSGANGTGLDTAANELIGTDPGLVSIKQTLSQRRAVLSDQMAGLTPANPVYKQDQDEIAALDRSMDRATAEARERAERQLQDKLRLDLRRTAAVEGGLNAQLAEQTAKATGAGPKLQRAAELETDLQRLSARYATVDDAIRGLQLETSGPGQAHLVLAARTPDAPQPSRSKLVLLLALPLALLCGVSAAVIARKRDPRLYLAGDVQDVLGFAPMCLLPDAAEVSGAAFDDFVLRLAGGLEGAYRHGGAHSFVFTAVSVTANTDGLLPKLCAKLQQLGFRAGCMHAEELMPQIGRPMAAGAAATQMERFLQEHDIVLIQAPPLLGSALTEYAVRCADATILLVQSAGTDRAELRRAAALLERLNPQGVGAVLEDVPLQYADSGFREAVRAADQTHRRLPKRPESGAARAEPVRQAKAGKIELPERPSRHGSQRALAHVSESAAVHVVDAPAAAEPAVPEPAAAEPREMVEFTEPSQDGREREPAEPVRNSPHVEPMEAAVPRAVPRDPTLITFSEAAFSGAAASPSETGVPSAAASPSEAGVPNEVPAAGTDAWSRTRSKARVSAEGSAAFEAVPAPPADTVEPAKVKPERGWAAWKYADPPTVKDVAAAQVPTAPSYEETKDVSSTEGAWAERTADAEPSPSSNVALVEPVAPSESAEAVEAVEAVETVEPVEAVESVEAVEALEAVDAVEPVERTPPVQDASMSRGGSVSSKQPAPGPAPGEPARPGKGKPVSWLRRLLRRTEKPVLRMTPERNEAKSSESEGSLPVMSSAAPEPVVVYARDEEPAPAKDVTLSSTIAEMEVAPPGEPAAFDEAASPSEVSEPVPIDSDAPRDYAHSHDAHSGDAQGGIEAAAAADGQTAAAPELEMLDAAAARDAPGEKHASGPSATPDALLARDMRRQEVIVPAPEAMGSYARTPHETVFAEPLPPVPSIVAPPLPVFTRPEASVAPETRREAEKRQQVKTTEHVAADPKGPLGTFPRLRTSPITMAAVPGLTTPVENKAAIAARRAHAPEGPPPVAWTPAARTESALPPHRRGLARAAAQASADEGPPARASEGLTAMRTGAGLRRAMVRGEATMRSQMPTPEAAAPPRAPGMSRRWAMLSRFERSGAEAALPEDDAQATTRGATSEGRADAARKSRV